MCPPVNDLSNIPLRKLAWPLLVENLLRTSLLSVDTVMLGRFSPKAVAAMSLVNQLSFFIMLLFAVVSTGASILIAQNLGAGRKHEAGLVGVASLVLALGLSVVTSVAFALGSGALLANYPLEPDVARYGVQFLSIFGGGSFFMALSIGQATVLRAWGYPRDPMLVNVLCLVLTVAGNALCLFGPFGFPVLGVVGVALSTVFSQAVACALLFAIIRVRREVVLPLREATRIPARVYRSMLAVGVPTAGENLSYNLSQIVTLRLLATLGTTSLATYGIVLAVMRFVFITGVSIGLATQIKVGYLVGAGRADEAQGRVYRYFLSGLVITAAGVVIVMLLQRPIFSLFTDDAAVLAMIASVMLVELALEPGRTANVIVIPALKGAGDVRFPVYVGVASMWGVGVFGAWFLGLHLGLGLPGIWVAMASDEWLRSGVMLLRWRSGAWKSKRLLSPAPAVAIEGA
jgi:putative MATE family efflux protein